MKNDQLDSQSPRCFLVFTRNTRRFLQLAVAGDLLVEGRSLEALGLEDGDHVTVISGQLQAGTLKNDKPNGSPTSGFDLEMLMNF